MSTRARLLQIAREVFAARGFDGTKMRDIAEAANTTHSMITYHFGSKEQLWREGVRDMFARERAYHRRDEEFTRLPLEEQLGRSVRDYVRYCSRHPEHARITVSESIRGGERLDWMVEQFVKDDHRQVIPLFARLMDTGILPRMPMPSLVYAIVGMAQLPFMLARESLLAFGYDMMDDAAIEAHADGILALLLPRAGTGAGPARPAARMRKRRS